MKIDCHVHLWARSHKSGGYMRLGITGNLMMLAVSHVIGGVRKGEEHRAEERYVDWLSKQVAASELNRAVLLALDQVYTKNGTVDLKQSRFFVPNHFVSHHCRRYPKHFLFGASVHPYRKDALDSLDRQKERGAVLIKLLPNSQGFDPSDPDLVHYYRKLAELHLPLLIHAGYEHSIPVIDQLWGDPVLLRRALDQGTTVIVAHGGTAGRFHRRETFGSFLKLLAGYPNCYGDTSALTNLWRAKYLKELLCPRIMEQRYGVHITSVLERFVHGSDFPAPVTPLAFGVHNARKARAALPDKSNRLQLDIAVKRVMGVPDSCLTRAADLFEVNEYMDTN